MKYDLGINMIGLSLQLAFVAVMFFIYSLFLQSKLGENSFFHRWELINDKFLIICFAYYFISLILNVVISIIKFDVSLLNETIIFIYVFINVFSLCLTFSLFIFILQLINPVKHAYYLISKITLKRILDYNLCRIDKEEVGISLKLNTYSPIIKKEDPLMAVHELMIPSVEKFDYRSIGLIIQRLLFITEKQKRFSSKKEHLRFSFHILSYTVRLQKNLNQKHKWNDLGFIRYFTFIYIEFIEKNLKKDNLYMVALYKISLLKVLFYYYTNHHDVMKGISFIEHTDFLTSIENHKGDKQLNGLIKIFSNEIKNPSLYIKKIIKIKGFVHPWV